MKLPVAALACLAQLADAPARAEAWVSMDPEAAFTIEIDTDSLRRGDDGLIYFRERYYDGAEPMDMAADCAARRTYLIRIHTAPPIDYPDWRAHPQPVTPDSLGAAVLDFVCARG